MTDETLRQIVIAAPLTITAVTGFVAVLIKLKALHHEMNSRLTELIKASIAQGRQDERDSHTVTVEGVPKEGES